MVPGGSAHEAIRQAARPDRQNTRPWRKRGTTVSVIEGPEPITATSRAPGGGAMPQPDRRSIARPTQTIPPRVTRLFRMSFPLSFLAMIPFYPRAMRRVRRRDADRGRAANWARRSTVSGAGAIR